MWLQLARLMVFQRRLHGTEEDGEPGNYRRQVIRRLLCSLPYR
jgi:hypothetical protein